MTKNIYFGRVSWKGKKSIFRIKSPFKYVIRNSRIKVTFFQIIWYILKILKHFYLASWEFKDFWSIGNLYRKINVKTCTSCTFYLHLILACKLLILPKCLVIRDIVSKLPLSSFIQLPNKLLFFQWEAVFPCSCYVAAFVF